MGFEEILRKRGISVQIVKIDMLNNNGILEKSEVSIVDTKAIIQPLRHEEIRYWNDLGYSKAQMKAYFKEDWEEAKRILLEWGLIRRKRSCKYNEDAIKKLLKFVRFKRPWDGTGGPL